MNPWYVRFRKEDATNDEHVEAGNAEQDNVENRGKKNEISRRPIRTRKSPDYYGQSD